MAWNTTWPCFANNYTTGVLLYNSSTFNPEQPCPLGFFCPNSSSFNGFNLSAGLPVLCPPSEECIVDRLSGRICSQPQGIFEPMICPAGYYCPNSYTKTICPSGSYCLTGSYQATKCDTFSICPAGSEKHVSLDGLFSVLMVDFFLILLYAYIRIHQLKKSKVPLSAIFPLNKLCNKSHKEKTALLEHGDLKEPTRDEALKSLLDLYKESMNGKEIAVSFRFENMKFELPNGQTPLNNVSGVIQPSKLTAIVGPSGCGKTTFMNVLCGKVDRTFGELFICGKSAEMSQFKKIMGYVPQEDVMLRELTVFQVVQHSARIRCPTAWSLDQIDKFVYNILEILHLKHVAHVTIGDETQRGISGGQRKRVNIAMELASLPLCLFLDEPTSGLDATAALEVVEVLSQITKLGVTIVAVIHQPRIEVFEKFDDLIVMTQGHIVYQGAANQVQGHFQQLGYTFVGNTADSLMDILSDRHPKKMSKEELLTAYSPIASPDNPTSSTFHENVDSILNSRGAPLWRQIYYCHQRSISQQFARPFSFVLETFVCMLAGGLLGAAVADLKDMYHGIYVSPMTGLTPAPLEWLMAQFGMMVGMTVALAGSPPACNVFSPEKPVYWRETSSGQSPIAYYIGKNVSVFYRMIITSLHFTFLLHLLSRPVMSFRNQYIMNLLNFYDVYGLSTFTSMIVGRNDATLLATVAGLFAATFCGYGPTLVQADKWKMKWFWDLSFNRWATEALYSDSITPYSHVYIVQAGADYFGYTINRIPLDFSMMLILGTVWRIAAYFPMVFLNRAQQR